MEEGLCVALFPGIGNRYVHVFSHLGECVEIVIYQLPCFFPVNVETLGKTKHGDAIDDAKIGPLALVRSSRETSSMGFLYIFAAVAAWIS